MKSISLIGFMGAGKTAVAKSLARQLGYQVVSTDDLIIKKENRPIAKIFEKNGEAYFRNLEKQVVDKDLTGNNLVIDCGGGIALQKENLARLKQNSCVIYLKTSVGEILKRTQGQKHRPLLNVKDPKARIKELLTLREPFYAQADITVITDRKSVEQVSCEILKILN